MKLNLIQLFDFLIRKGYHLSNTDDIISHTGTTLHSNPKYGTVSCYYDHRNRNFQAKQFVHYFKFRTMDGYKKNVHVPKGDVVSLYEFKTENIKHELFNLLKDNNWHFENDVLIDHNGTEVKFSSDRNGYMFFIVRIRRKQHNVRISHFKHFLEHGDINVPIKPLKRSYDPNSIKNSNHGIRKSDIEPVDFDYDIRKVKLEERLNSIYYKISEQLTLVNGKVLTKNYGREKDKDFFVTVNGKTSKIRFQYIKYYLENGKMPAKNYNGRMQKINTLFQVIAVIKDDCFNGGKLEIRNVDLNDVEFRKMLHDNGYSVEWFLTTK